MQGRKIYKLNMYIIFDQIILESYPHLGVEFLETCPVLDFEFAIFQLYMYIWIEHECACH